MLWLSEISVVLALHCTLVAGACLACQFSTLQVAEYQLFITRFILNIVNTYKEKKLSNKAQSEYASPVWHNLITKKQSDQIEAIQKRAIRIIYPCAHDMPYTSAIFLADLPTMSDRRDQLARKLSTIQPISSLHNLLPPPREHPSITRFRVPSKFPRIPTRTKKYLSFFSHALSHYQTS